MRTASTLTVDTPVPVKKISWEMDLTVSEFRGNNQLSKVSE